jgi:hypothetical protein
MGVFVKYKGVNGPSGTPKTVVELIREIEGGVLDGGS